MSTKILVIGQAPPAVKQEVPYDTTLLYDMFLWVGITKEQAQDMFDFEALVDKFPGFSKDGHAKPSLPDIIKHYREVLKPKIIQTDKILVLGTVAKNYIEERQSLYPTKRFLYIVHPSKRNYALVYKQKEYITKVLKDFITVPNRQPK